MTEQSKPKPIFVTKFLSQTVEDERPFKRIQLIRGLQTKYLAPSDGASSGQLQWNNPALTVQKKKVYGDFVVWSQVWTEDLV